MVKKFQGIPRVNMVKIKMIIIVMVAKIRHIYYKHNTMHVRKHNYCVGTYVVLQSHRTYSHSPPSWLIATSSTAVLLISAVCFSDIQSPKQCQYKLKTAAQ